MWDLWGWYSTSLGTSALICELRGLNACSLDILGFQADLGVESLGPSLPLAFHPFSTSCCQKLGWEERKEGTGGEGELTFWQVPFIWVVFIYSIIFIWHVSGLHFERRHVTSDTWTRMSLLFSSCLLDCHFRARGRGCLWLRSFYSAEIVSWPFTRCWTTTLGGKRNDHGSLCRCSAQPPHPAAHSLGDGFYWVVRLQDPGETQKHSSGLTTCFL